MVPSCPRFLASRTPLGSMCLFVTSAVLPIASLAHLVTSSVSGLVAALTTNPTSPRRDTRTDVSLLAASLLCLQSAECMEPCWWPAVALCGTGTGDPSSAPAELWASVTASACWALFNQGLSGACCTFKHMCMWAHESARRDHTSRWTCVSNFYCTISAVGTTAVAWCWCWTLTLTHYL